MYEGIPVETYCIFNVQTNSITRPEFGECKPSEVDLTEYQGVRIWDGGGWAIPEPEPTQQEKGIMEIRAYAEAIIELTDKL